MTDYKELDKLSEERYNEKLALMEKKLRKVLLTFDLKVDNEQMEKLTVSVLYQVIAPIYFEYYDYSEGEEE